MLNISCESSAKQIIHMKCQALSEMKKKKKKEYLRMLQFCITLESSFVPF